MGEAQWIAKLGNLRNVIRQELIGSQLDAHIPDGVSVLDVGCGQGTQGLRLLGRGCSVVGIEPSEDLRNRFASHASELHLLPELMDGSISEVPALLSGRSFDAVCAHGLLMYLDDVAEPIASLADRVAPGGMLSITFKNAHGLAMRPALRGEWQRAIDAFSSAVYDNELGIQAQAHELAEIRDHLAASGFEVRNWYGVRVFNDAIDGDVIPPSRDRLDLILRAEDLASRTDPYRWFGSQIHVIASR